MKNTPTNNTVYHGMSREMQDISLEIARETFREMVELYYEKLTEDILNYESLVHDGVCFLDYTMIRKLQYRLEYCAHKAHNFLCMLRSQLIQNEEGKLLMSELIDDAWNLQLITEAHLNSLFAQSSLGMKYFSKTFAQIESIDPSHFRKEAPKNQKHQVIGEILEIAGVEREAALKRLAPKLKYISQEYGAEVGKLSQEIMRSIIARARYIGKYMQRKKGGLPTSQYQGTIIMAGNLQGREPFLHGDYTNISTKLDAIIEEHQSRIYDCLGEFLTEENDLQFRLRRGLGMGGLYRPFDLEAWLSPELGDTP